MPAEYTLFGAPRPWTVADVVAVSSLIGGIFGDGGGSEVANANLLSYLQGQLGQSAGSTAFTEFKEQNDPAAPTTVVNKSFPYEIPGKVKAVQHRAARPPRRPAHGRPRGPDQGLHQGRLQPGRAADTQGPAAAARPDEQRPGGGGQPLGRRAPHRGLRPAGGLLRARHLDAGGPARSRLRRRGGLVPRHRLRRTGPRRGLRLVGHLIRHRHDRPAPGADLQPARREGAGARHLVPLPRQVRPDGEREVRRRQGPGPRDPPDRARRGPGLDHRAGTASRWPWSTSAPPTTTTWTR